MIFSKTSHFTLFLVIFLHVGILYGQRQGIQNLHDFDKKRIRFGFILGFNEMDFSIKRNNDIVLYDSLMSVTTKPQFGFHIGIISDLKLAEHLNLRFIPSLSFGDRIIEYNILEKTSNIEKYTRKIESTFIEFPLLLKFKSVRLTNTRAYLIGGGKYSIDLASLILKRAIKDDVIKLYRNDYSFELGVGFDFYLSYFKFGAEIKMAYGIRDMLKRENTIYTNSIDYLKSKIFYLTFTFE